MPDILCEEPDSSSGVTRFTRIQSVAHAGEELSLQVSRAKAKGFPTPILQAAQLCCVWQEAILVSAPADAACISMITAFSDYCKGFLFLKACFMKRSPA